ncbi:hypothetical protein PWT90_00565 [Aphanocladium album]|nr:hypothetical protein PWT90_00565 [Aphanocladium album]
MGMACLPHSLQQRHAICACEELGKHMDFPVMEGAHLDGLSSAGVRRRFEEWALGKGVPRLRPRQTDPTLLEPNDYPASYASYAAARFHHCLLVDRRCLESLETKEPIIAVVEKNWEGMWDRLSGNEPLVLGESLCVIEGNPTDILGWWYMPLSAVVDMYDDMSQEHHTYNSRAPRVPDVYDSMLDWSAETWRGDVDEGHYRDIEPCTAPFSYKVE